MIGSAHGVDAEVVRAELRRILESADFEASERNRHFLSYVVEETLNGRGDRIKAYNIATSVFGRGADFDPQLDSIVRIEAGRLRRALDRYYLTAGRGNGIRIAIPRGGYVPAFQPCHGDAKPGVPAAADRRAAKPRPGCSILVRPFEEDGDLSAFPNFSRGLTRQVIVGLTRFTDLFVFGTETAFSRDGAADAAAAADPLHVDLLLSGGTTLSGSHFTLDVLLSDARTGRYIWGETFERKLDPAEITRVRDEVANSVVRSLAQPYGVIFSEKAREVEGRPPESVSSYESVVRYHIYARSLDRSLLDPVRTGLEQATRRDPDYAEAFSCLSQVYVDMMRFGQAAPGWAAELRERALRTALRAVALAPHSSHSHHALARAYWFSGDVEGALAEWRIGLSLNPNDTEIMSDLGLRHAVLMEWDKALPLLEESYARNPAQPGNCRIGFALWHYMHGRYRDALMEMRRAKIEHVAQAFVMVAAAAGQLGLAEEAKAAVGSILRLDPTYGDHAVADLTARNLHPEMIAAVLDGLRKAGLPGRDTAVRGAAPMPARDGLREPAAARY